MKKVEEKYYCDLCGKECEHTPDYVLPELFTGAFQNVTTNSKQKDLCPECEKEVAYILNLIKSKKMDSNPMSNMILEIITK